MKLVCHVNEWLQYKLLLYCDVNCSAFCILLLNIKCIYIDALSSI